MLSVPQIPPPDQTASELFARINGQIEELLKTLSLQLPLPRVTRKRGDGHAKMVHIVRPGRQ